MTENALIPTQFDLRSIAEAARRSDMEMGTTLRDTGGRCYMRFQKEGFWVYGRELIEPDPEGLWIVHPADFRHGYIAWHNGSVEWQHEENIAVPFSTIGVPHGLNAKRGAEKTKGCTMVCIAGDDEGVQGHFTSNTDGGMQFCDGIRKEITDRIEEGEPAVFPVIKLWASSYENAYGKVNKPRYEVVAWMTAEQVEAKEYPEIEDGTPPAIEEKPAPAPEPQPRRRAAAEDAPVKAAPRRRSR